MWTSARRDFGWNCWRVEWNEVKCKWQLWLSRFGCDCGLKKWRVKSRWESVEKRKRGGGQLCYPFALLLLLGSAVELNNWPAWRAVAGIVASAVKIAGQKAECRAVWTFRHFHASTFCVICLWRRKEFCWVVSSIFECGQQGLLLLLIAVVTE